jgi:hypothetical protein
MGSAPFLAAHLAPPVAPQLIGVFLTFRGACVDRKRDEEPTFSGSVAN